MKHKGESSEKFWKFNFLIIIKQQVKSWKSEYIWKLIYKK
jgi:hypothetical protein